VEHRQLQGLGQLRKLEEHFVVGVLHDDVDDVLDFEHVLKGGVFGSEIPDLEYAVLALVTDADQVLVHVMLPLHSCQVGLDQLEVHVHWVDVQVVLHFAVV